MNLWLILIFVSAIFVTIATILQKKLLTHIHALEFSASRAFYSFLLSLLLLPFIDLSYITPRIIVLLYFISLLFSGAFLFQNKAIRHLDISESTPLINLSPLFLLIMAPFLLGENLAALQIVGVFCLVIGIYVIEINHKKQGLLYPIKNFLSSPHIHHMLFALVVLSFVQIMDKLTLTYFMDPLTYVFFIWVFTCFNLCLLEIYRFGIKELKNDIVHHAFPLFIVTLFSFPAQIFYLLAVNLQSISIIIPFKRISSVFVTFFGGNFFHEQNLLPRIIGTIITLLGILLIVFH